MPKTSSVILEELPVPPNIEETGAVLTAHYGSTVAARIVALISNAYQRGYLDGCAAGLKTAQEVYHQ